MYMKQLTSTYIVMCTGICGDQEALWRETLEDGHTMETEARAGGCTPTTVNPKMLHDIQSVLSRLVRKAEQLIGNHTTNLAECWMHIRSKFDGGKVINRSQSGSWEHRCMGAGLRQNMGVKWGPQVWKHMTNTSPSKVFTDTAECSAKRVKRDRTRKNTDKAKESRRKSKYKQGDDTTAARSAYNRHDDGITPEEVTEDVPLEHLKQLQTTFYNTKVIVTQAEVTEIEENTRNQADSMEWLAERRKRITASKAGGIAKMRKTTKRGKKVQEMLYSTFRGNDATRYGSAKEEETIEQYIAYQKGNGRHHVTVDKCGLFVSFLNPWLAASPDGLVSDPSQGSGLIEIKNPYSMRGKSISEACKTSTFCLENNSKDNTYKLKTKHDYFYQVQCQLYCTNRDWFDFILRTDKEIHIQRIQRDNSWWNKQLEILKKFYFNALLPELACPRYRFGGIREPIASE